MKKNKFLLTIGAPKWRLPMLVKLADSGYDIYVISNDSKTFDEKIKTLKVRSNFLGFYPSSELFKKYSKGVCIFDKRLFIWMVKTKIINRVYLWGLGLGNNIIINKFRHLLAKKSLGVITYMPSGQKFNDKNAGFIVNSIFNKPKYLWEKSNKILFIGSLRKRKRIDVLLNAIKIANQNNEFFSLDIIGDGPQKNYLKSLSKELNIDENIHFHGQVDCSEKKEKIISGSFLSVSLGQAGLSILESMSYGIPFLTAKNAISGGEVDNIINDYNGFLIDDFKDSKFVAKKIIEIKNMSEVKNVSYNSYDYFCNFANGDLMVERFKDIVG